MNAVPSLDFLDAGCPAHRMSDSDATPIVTVHRPEVPLLWLDTSILIGLVRVKESSADARLSALENVVGQKVRAGKLLCLESDQASEVEGHPGAASVRRNLRRLTYNVRLRPRLELDAFQIAEGMRAYLAGSPQIDLPARAFFEERPEDVLAQVRRDGWILTVDTNAHPDVRARAKQVKQQNLDWLEALRLENRASGVRYAEQLARERSGFLDGQRAILERWMKEIQSDAPDPLLVFAGVPLARHLRTWAALGGAPERARDYFTSEHFLRLPCNDIQFRLYAQMLTIDRAVESGDAMDIQHMTAALPSATWVLTERSLASRVRRLGLDAAWGSNVYSLRELDGLLAHLASL